MTNRSEVAAGLPELFAVVDVARERVVARGLNVYQASGFASGWRRDNGNAVVVPEPISWPSDDQVLELSRQVHSVA
jgi:hypothetical protein